MGAMIVANHQRQSFAGSTKNKIPSSLRLLTMEVGPGNDEVAVMAEVERWNHLQFSISILIF